MACNVSRWLGQFLGVHSCWLFDKEVSAKVVAKNALRRPYHVTFDVHVHASVTALIGQNKQTS